LNKIFKTVLLLTETLNLILYVVSIGLEPTVVKLIFWNGTFGLQSTFPLSVPNVTETAVKARAEFDVYKFNWTRSVLLPF
jgi:hypothetical protein